MSEGGGIVQAARRSSPGPGAQAGPLGGLCATVLLLAVLATTVGLGGAGWLVGLASGLVLNAALARALWRDPSTRLAPADWVTLVRATLAVGVAALTAASFERDVAVATLVTLASVALALDFVDGWVARRTATESALGARLDGEVDAFLILVLSVEVAPSVGAWVLAIGLARYVFLAAGWGLHWLRAPLPRRDWRKTVTASQGVALVIAASGVVPTTVSRDSSGRRSRHARRVVRPRRLVAVAAPGLRPAPSRCDSRPAARREQPCSHCSALAIVWAALVAPIQPWLLTPGLFVRLPLEGLVLVGLAVALPTRAGRFVPWLIGPPLGLLVLLKLFDIGFFISLDRPFNPVEDWSYLSIGVGTVRDTFGSRDADLAVAAAVLVGLAALVIPTLAVGQLTRVAACHRARSLRGTGRAHCRLGALLGVRRPGLRRWHRIHECGASRRQRGARRASRTSATRRASRP